MNPTEQAHKQVANVLLNGRILVNGLPLTANEISNLIGAERLLYEKAFQFDKVQQVAAAKKAEKKPEKEKK